MAYVSIAECARDYLIESNANNCSPDLDSGYYWSLDCGKLDALHDTYAMHVERNSVPRSLQAKSRPYGPGTAQRYAVLNALKNTVDGRILFECFDAINLYPGIVNGKCRVFVLRKPCRNMKGIN